MQATRRVDGDASPAVAIRRYKLAAIAATGTQDARGGNLLLKVVTHPALKDALTEATLADVHGWAQQSEAT